MKKNLLTPDELGEKGESHFKEICADAQLICNKSDRDRDRAGWDFIVDFPFIDQEELSLDKRIAPPSCHIQVKTVYASTKSVRLKLNMAERLTVTSGVAQSLLTMTPMATTRAHRARAFIVESIASLRAHRCLLPASVARVTNENLSVGSAGLG